jgi:hypothetical protein
MLRLKDDGGYLMEIGNDETWGRLALLCLTLGFAWWWVRFSE